MLYAKTRNFFTTSGKVWFNKVRTYVRASLTTCEYAVRNYLVT
jgi:hypothetical protein